MFSLSTLTLFGDSIQFCVKIAQSCLTLRNPMDYIVHEILQARILEWVAFPFSRGSSQNSNRIGLPHCRWSLYQLSHKGSPSSSIMSLKIRLQPDTSPLNHRLINPITLLNTVLTSLIGISDVVCVCARTQLHRTLCVPLHCSPLQAPLSMGFPRQEYWRGLPFPTLRNLPNTRIKPLSLTPSPKPFSSTKTYSTHILLFFSKEQCCSLSYPNQRP